MNRLIAVLTICFGLFCVPAVAQIPGGGVGQQGSVTANDCTAWAAPGLVKDAGAPCGSGSGTVTSVSVVTANGVSATGQPCTTTCSLTFSLGAITPTSINGANVAFPISTNNMFVGVGAGNGSVTGTGNTAIGYQSGTALTVPGSAANPQADTFYGYQAGNAVTSARESTFIGYQAGLAATGNGTGIEDGLNTFIGSLAGTVCTTCINIVAVGQKAGAATVTGQNSVYIGAHAGLSDTTNNNVYIGNQAGGAVTTSGTDNIAIGQVAGNQMGGASGNNVIIGSNAGNGASFSSSYNVFIGRSSATALTTSTQDVFVGYNSGSAVTSGNNNTFIGYQSGTIVTNGVSNVFIGTNSGDSASTGTSNTFIAGASSQPINNIYFGKGISNTTPTGFTINGTSSIPGTSSNTAGGAITIQSGNGTGNATPSQIVLKSPVAVASGTGAQTQTTGLIINGGTAVLSGYTVSTLPSASLAGSFAYVTDQLTTCAAAGAALVGGGAVTCPVFYNGSAWVGG